MDDIARTAESAQPPIYTHRTRYITLLFFLVLVGVTPLASVFNLQWGWLISFLCVFASIMMVGILGDRDVLVKNLYAEKLRSIYVQSGSSDIDEESIKNIAEKNVRKSAPVIVCSILAFFYISGAFVYNASTDLVETKSVYDVFVNVFIVFSAIFWILCALVVSFVILSVGNRTDADFDILMDGMKSGVSSVLLPHDRNDLEIVGLSVQSQTLSRRVDAYTLESALLSALAFSAFISIIFSDKGPDLGSTLSTTFNHYCPPLNLTPGNFCIPYITTENISSNVMFYICAPLLSCSISFLAVLVTRLRFSEAIHYTEETIRTAEKLNEKENILSDGNVKTAYSKEIDRLMMRARAGFSDISPMVRFMKTFRDVGIFSFIVSTCVCGFVYSPWLSIAILLIFISAFLYGVMDTHRRKSFFLPLLEATVLSLNRKVHR